MYIYVWYNNYRPVSLYVGIYSLDFNGLFCVKLKYKEVKLYCFCFNIKYYVFVQKFFPFNVKTRETEGQTDR